MNLVRLGRTEMMASEVGLGTWAFASQIYGAVQRRDALAAIRYAIEHGITLFDSAPLYGSAEVDGISESILGEGLGSDRASVLVSTKFGRYSSDGAAPDFSAARARESVESSLRRLGTDYIDVLFFHSPFSPDEIMDDVWAELDRLRTEGKIRAIGHSISMFEDTQQMARDWAQQRKIDVVQVVYSLMNRQSADLIGFLRQMETAVFARESLANGFLSGKITRDTVFGDRNINQRYTQDEVVERVDYVDNLSFLVRDDVESMVQAAVRWVLDNPGVSTVLAGARNADELRDWILGASAHSYTEPEHVRAREVHPRDFQAA